MKRIVKETLGNGSVQYRVETNKILGFIPCGWHTDNFCLGEYGIQLDAVFKTLDEAELFVFGENSKTKIIKREIL